MLQALSGNLGFQEWMSKEMVNVKEHFQLPGNRYLIEVCISGMEPQKQYHFISNKKKGSHCLLRMARELIGKSIKFQAKRIFKGGR
jgi:hypothetical protein